MEEIVKYDLSPQRSLKLAETLTKFITERNLSTNIQGKQYVNVEGWQFAGCQMGVFPVLTSLIDLSNANEIKYRAEVDLRKEDGSIIGKGIAICSNKERTKKNFEEYAIASMAQTRAAGKAYRMLISWLMKAAGFEGTPTEDMTDIERPDMPTEGEKKILVNLVFTSTLSDDKKMEALATINGCENYKLYQQIQARLEDLQPSVHEIQNPSQKQINKHLSKTL